MTDNELLLSLSNIIQAQIEPMKKDIQQTRLILEHDILPRLQNIESCYTSTYNRYSSGTNQIEAIQSDVDILKKVVTEHSVQLQKIS